MNGKNLNQIMKQDPSLEGAKYVKAYDRACPVEIKIIEMNILQMVGQDVCSNENLHFKILQKNKDPRENSRLQIAKGEQSIENKLHRDRNNTLSHLDPRLNPDTDLGKSNLSKPAEQDLTPEILRLEIMSDNDYFFQYIYECDQYLFNQLKGQLDLNITFAQFPTMLVKLVNNCIEDPEHFKCVMIMNTDSTATLKIFKILEFKSLEQISITLKLGEVEKINKHVSFRYKLIRHQLQVNQSKLQEVCNILKLKNPSLIAQINKQAMISQPYHMRMQGARNPMDGFGQSQMSFRSIKSKAMSNYSKATFK